MHKRNGKAAKIKRQLEAIKTFEKRKMKLLNEAYSAHSIEFCEYQIKILKEKLNIEFVEELKEVQNATRS